MSTCLDCKIEIDWNKEGGVLWEGETFCEEHNPEDDTR